MSRKLLQNVVKGMLVASMTFSGCAADQPAEPEVTMAAPGAEAPAGKREATGGGKEDRWDYTNNPRRFGGELNYTLDELPTNGRADRAAWPSTYWPTYEDAINARWNGTDELSPAEKFDMAFNGWTPPEGFMELKPYSSSNCRDKSWDAAYYEQLGPLATYVSKYMGNADARDGIDNDDDGEIDECGDRDGVETWWGLCHAWVPASMLEDTPQRSVTYNGVTFHIGDMQALLIAAYNRSPASMIGGRCNSGNGDEEVERDEHGRASNVSCRDSNPGSLHVIMTNFLGVRRAPFAIDRTYDFQVWNQPVVAFEIRKQEEISAAKANELLGREGDSYLYNDDAVTFFEVNADLTYITESYASTTLVDPSRYERVDRLQYILEVDADGKIIGGEYYGAGRTRHPDFLWSPRRINRSSVPNLDLDQVRMLIQMSREPDDAGDGGDGGEVKTFEGQGGVAIPDNNPSGASSTATVEEDFTVAKVSVALNISHTYIGDLRVTLTHAGIEQVLHNNEGGSRDDINRSINVSGFEQAPARGAWVLKAVDSAGLDVGKIVSWTLKLTPDGAGIGGDEGGDEPQIHSFSGTGGVAIPDNDAGGISSEAAVPVEISSGSVSISVNITHTWIGDLTVTVKHGGDAWVLHEKTGSSQDDIVKTYPLESFSGSPAGTWTLSVVDSARRDVGELKSWSVNVTE